MVAIEIGNKRLVTNLIVNVSVCFISFAVSFFLTPYLVIHVGKEAYSFYPMANNIIACMSVLTVILNSMAARFIMIAVVKGENDTAKQYYTSVFLSNIILSGILLIPMTFCVLNANSLFNISKEIYGDVIWLMVMLFGGMLIRLVASVFGVATFVKNRMDINAYINLAEMIFRACLFVILFHILVPSIAIVGFVNLLTSILFASLQYLTSKKLIPDFKIAKVWICFSAIKRLCVAGAWNAISSLGSVLLLSISLLLSNAWINEAAGGDVALAQMIPQIITSITAAVSATLVPSVTAIYAQGDRKLLLNKVQESQSILGWLTIVPISLGVIFGKNFFGLWVPNQNAVHLQLLSVMLMGQVYAHANMWVIYNTNITNNTIKVPALLLILAGIVNVIMIKLLLVFTNLGVYAVIGSSIFICVVYYMIFIPMYTAIRLGYKFNVFYFNMLKIFAYTFLFCGFGFLTKNYCEISSWAVFFVYVGIYGIIGFLFYAVIVLGLKHSICFLKIKIGIQKK